MKRDRDADELDTEPILSSILGSLLGIWLFQCINKERAKSVRELEVRESFEYQHVILCEIQQTLLADDFHFLSKAPILRFVFNSN